MQYFTHTKAGDNHENQDYIAVWPHPIESNALICVLADGQGGQSGGQAASQTAVQQTLTFAVQYPVKQLLKKKTWFEILRRADTAVAENTGAGFTTLVALCVFNNHVCGVSCGDSMALLANRKKHIALTEKQHKNPPMGSNAACPTGFAANLKNSTLLLMTDGVWRFIGNDKIAEMSRFHQGQELILRLETLQREQNGGKLPDDFSIIVLQSS